MLSVVDLFCGCGGLSKGFEQAGFEIAAAFDGWSPAIRCYNANFKHQAIQCDLSNVGKAVKVIRPIKPNMIIGGPPCQEFSTAGSREEGSRAELTDKFAEIVVRLSPDYFVMENVPRVRNSNAYAKARQLYIENGYGLTEIVLDASRCGVPQKRSRFFCIGARQTSDNFLLDALFKACEDKETTVRGYFRDHNIALEVENFYRHPRNYDRRAIFSVDEAAPTVRGVNRPKPEAYRLHENDSVNEKELETVRSLTLKERASIQTFPKDFQFEGLDISRGNLEQMVGNAVPVQLAQFVAKRLLDYILEQKKRAYPHTVRHEFSAWLREKKHYNSDRSIRDVFSRIRRARKINHGDMEINQYFLADLLEKEEFEVLSSSVKSQIKKAINLWREYEEWMRENERRV